MRKIALEEHFLTDEMEPYIRDTLANIAPELATTGRAALKDFGQARLDIMATSGRGSGMVGYNV